jgi:hypothetical protein
MSDGQKHRVLAAPAFQLAAKPADRMFVFERSPHGRACDVRPERKQSHSRPALLELLTVFAERTLPSGIAYQQLPRNRGRSQGGGSWNRECWC